MRRPTTHTAEAPPREAGGVAGAPQAPVDAAEEVALVLAGMSYGERVRAYRTGAFSAHELAVAAARRPEDMPKLNGEYEWLVVDSADLD